MDIGEGANDHDINNENVKAVDIKLNKTRESIMLDSDDERIINNNNTLDYRNKENETITKRNENQCIQKDYCNEEVSAVNMNSMFGGNTSKLNYRKLYSGRDSPVDLAHETHNNRSSLLEMTLPLHPALDNSTVTKGCVMNKKKRMSQFSILTKNMNDDTFIFSSPRVRRKRTNVRSSKLRGSKCRSSYPASIVNKKKSVMDAAVNTTHEMEGEPNNSTSLKEMLNDEQQCKVVNNETKELTQSLDSSPTTTVELNEITSQRSLSPVLCLRRSRNIQEVPNLNKTKACLLDKTAVVRLERLMVADSQKIENRSKTKACLLDKTVVIKLVRLSESVIQKYKSNKSETRQRNLQPVVLLKNLSKSDIQKYKTGEEKKWARLVYPPAESYESDTTVAEKTDPILLSSGYVDSDQSTVIMVGCQNSSRNCTSNDSDSTVADQYAPVVMNGYVNSNLKKKSTIGRRNKLNNCMLRKKSKEKEADTCDGGTVIASEFQKLQEKSSRRADDDIVIVKDLRQNKKIRRWRENFDAVTDSSVSERNDRTSNESGFNRNEEDRTAKSQKHLSSSSDNNKSPTIIPDSKHKNYSKSSETVLSQNSHDSEDIENMDILKKLDKSEITIIRRSKEPKRVEMFEIGENKNTNHVNYIDTPNSSLKNTHTATSRLFRAETRKNASGKDVNTRVLCFRTKIFDSDLECSPCS